MPLKLHAKNQRRSMQLLLIIHEKPSFWAQFGPRLAKKTQNKIYPKNIALSHLQSVCRQKITKSHVLIFNKL